jgi:hypothetical protein
MSESGLTSVAATKRRQVTADEWQPWALKLTDVIREVHPESVIFVSGIDWAHDLRGMEIERKNIVYSAHVYPNRSPVFWGRRFGHIGRKRPLFIGEWGGGPGDLEWGHRLHGFLTANSCGWTAWSWTDRPFLVEDARRGDYRPTAFGRLVQRALAMGM